MGIISKTGHVSTKALINHKGSKGDKIKILYTPAGGTELTILEYIVDPGIRTQFKIDLEEYTES